MPEPPRSEGVDLNSFAYKDSIGQSKWESYSASAVNFRFNGVPSISSYYYVVGKLCHVQVRINAGTSFTTYAASSYVTLPISSYGVAGFATATLPSTAINVATLVTSTSRIHMPESGSVTSYVNVFASYQI